MLHKPLLKAYNSIVPKSGKGQVQLLPLLIARITPLMVISIIGSFFIGFPMFFQLLTNKWLLVVIAVVAVILILRK